MSGFDRRSFLGASLSGAALSGAAAFTGAAFSGAAGWNPARADENDCFRPDTLFLTWQRDPTTTMTVQWIGTHGETSDTSVYYMGEGISHVLGSFPTWKRQPSIARPYADTDLRVYRCELTGLTPGADYQFKIGKLSPTFRFRTMPAKATDTIHFVSGGDCGVNAHTIANNIQAARQDPMFSVIGGDLAYDNGKTVEIALAFLRNYSRHMIGRNGRLIPMLACLGNHEVDGGYNKARSKAPYFFAIFDGLFSETSYAALDFGDYLSLVLLDTGHISPIEGEQTAWLEKVLRDRADHPHVLVVNHVPAYPSFRTLLSTSTTEGTGKKNRECWTPLFDKYRVPVVLEHHDHTFKRTKRLIDGMEHSNGVLYLGDGSWGRIRAPLPPGKLSFLAASSRDYHLSLHRIEGDERFHLALDENGRVMDLSHSGQRTRSNS